MSHYLFPVVTAGASSYEELTQNGVNLDITHLYLKVMTPGTSTHD